MLTFWLLTIRADLSDKFLLSIGKQIGNDVHTLGIQLGLSDSDIENIKSSEQHVAGNWGYQVLKIWRQRRGKHGDNANLLADALRDIGRVDLEQQVKEYKDPSSGRSTHVDEQITEKGARQNNGNSGGKEIDKDQLHNDHIIPWEGIIIAVLVIILLAAVVR
ncbi:unnamed protein product, partial [Owenia fusiformis]